MAANVADTLQGLADRMAAQIHEKRNPATASQNYTRRRADMIAGMARDADRLEREQYVLYGLAEARRAGILSPLLDKVTSRAAVELLLYRDRWPDFDSYHAEEPLPSFGGWAWTRARLPRRTPSSWRWQPRRIAAPRDGRRN